MVTWLLDHGAQVNLADNGDRSAAFYAAKMGNDALLLLLIARGAGALRCVVFGVFCCVRM